VLLNYVIEIVLLKLLYLMYVVEIMKDLV